MIINNKNLGHCVIVYFSFKFAEGHSLVGPFSAHQEKVETLLSLKRSQDSENQPVHSRYQTGNDGLEPLVCLVFMRLDGVNL